jgi:hypothetical protein
MWSRRIRCVLPSPQVDFIILANSTQWDGASSSWQKIGDVVDAVGSGRKQLYEGKEFDYVFDVDIHDGVPPLKLPYNVTGAQVFHYWL